MWYDEAHGGCVVFYGTLKTSKNQSVETGKHYIAKFTTACLLPLKHKNKKTKQIFKMDNTKAVTH
jgi:hypothetical protein